MTEQRPRSEKFERGLKARRKVMGDAYVDRTLANASDFGWPMQVMATEMAWDGIWNRPGLDHRSRSLLNLGMIAALNKPQEMRNHIRGAINNGVTKSELQEVCLQIAVYCGMPTGLDTVRLVEEVLKDMGLD